MNYDHASPRLALPNLGAVVYTSMAYMLGETAHAYYFWCCYSKRSGWQIIMTTQFPIRISKNSAIPMYKQVISAVIQAIENGTLTTNERIPSDRELSEQLSMSRMTIRRALFELTHDGWLYSEPGKGTFVRGGKVEGHQQILKGFSRDWRDRGYQVYSKVLAAQLVPADERLATCLYVPLHEAIFRLERVRFLNGDPIALEWAYLPYARCHGIMEHDFSQESLYAVLHRQYGVRFAWAKQVIEASLPSEQEIKLLEISATVPVLRGHRAVYLADEQVIEYSEAVYRGDRYRFESILFERPSSHSTIPSAGEASATQDEWGQVLLMNSLRVSEPEDIEGEEE